MKASAGAGRAIRRAALGAALLLSAIGTATGAAAQWSIGEAGPRLAVTPATRDRPATKRIILVVFANPVPGREAEFNEWYQDVHMGDLIQTPGMTGAQRYRLTGAVTPRLTQAGFNYGYAIVWDYQRPLDFVIRAPGTDPGSDIMSGGKGRRSPAFDYAPGGSLNSFYEAMTAKMVRPDGKGAFMPAADDLRTPRPDRFIVMDFASPMPGQSDEAFENAFARETNDVLALPGWMAAQRFKIRAQLGAGDKPLPLRLPRYLTIWEIEGGAQAAQEQLRTAMAAGKVTRPAADPATARFGFWRPISPHVTKEDIVR